MLKPVLDREVGRYCAETLFGQRNPKDEVQVEASGKKGFRHLLSQLFNWVYNWRPVSNSSCKFHHLTHLTGIRYHEMHFMNQEPLPGPHFRKVGCLKERKSIWSAASPVSLTESGDAEVPIDRGGERRLRGFLQVRRNLGTEAQGPSCLILVHYLHAE